jgi:electron transfer flavoprotein alpha subunit
VAEYKDVLALCETVDGKLTSLATELLGAGSRLARDLGEQLCAVITGSGISSLAREAIAFGADKVYVVDDPLLKDYLTDTYLPVIERVVKQVMPRIVLLGQTPLGRDLAPRLAFRLNTAASLDCVALEIDPATKRLLQTKPVYGGNALAVYTCETNPQIATARSKAMSPLERDTARQGEVITVAADLDLSTIRAKLLEKRVEAAAGVKLEEAHVVVTGGRGIGSAEGFKQLEALANLLKGAVGASRPPCDNGWILDSSQIGLTGKIVSPDLYIAVALSGSSQHLSGCSGAKTIVAINKDPEANIFRVAQYGVVGDWKKVLPTFTEKVKELLA